MYFGRLTASKGVRTLVEAAKKTGVKLVVVGTGELEDELRAQALGYANISWSAGDPGASFGSRL